MLATKRRLSLSENQIENVKKKARSVLNISDDTDISQFNDGNIVNIKLKNFVTYGQTEFKLSPTLNMIIGPNGTGKSTLVCAICLGLAGKPELLGRQKYAVDFIKEGTDSCVIEIAIKYGSHSNGIVTIKREMTRNSTSRQKEKSEWFIDTQRRDEKSVKALIKDLNIQLDNLCCFLPQDKVSAFSALKPTELLMETERAVGKGELLEQHLKLIEYDSSKKELTKTLNDHRDTINSLEVSREQFKSEVEKYQKYQQKKEEMINHEKLLPFAIVSDNKKKGAAYKARKKFLQERFNTFKQRIAPLDEKADVYRQQIQKLANEMIKHQTLSQKLIAEYRNNDRELQSIEQDIEDCQTERTKAENRSATKMKHLKEAIKEIEKQEAELQEIHLPTPEEHAKVSNIMEQIKGKLQTTLADISEIDQKMGDIRNEASSQINSLKRLETFVKSSDKFQIFNTFKPTKALENCKKAVEILRKHPEFEGRIFEPPILSISVSNEKFIKFFDVLIDRNTRLAFTAKTKADYDEAVNTIFRGINVSMRTLGNKGSYQKHATADFANSDFDGYLIDFAKGPAEVLQMIYEQCLQDIPVSSKEIPFRFLDVLKQKTNTGKPRFSKVCADNQIHYFSVSSFGSKQVISRTNFVRENKNSTFNAKAVNAEDLNELRKLKESIQEKQRKYKDLENENAELSNIRNKLQAEHQDLKNQKSKLQQRKIKHDSKIRNIETLKERKKKLEKDATQDMSEKISVLDSKINKLFNDKTELVASSSIPLAKIVEINGKLLSLEMKKLDMENKLTAVKSLSSKFSLLREEFQEMIQVATNNYNKIRKVDEVRRLKAQIESYSEEEKSLLADLMEYYTKENKFNEVDIRAKIQMIKSELNSVEDASAASIDKLRSIEEQLEKLYAIVPDLSEKLDKVNTIITRIEGPWKTELDNLVDRISKNFSTSFVSVASAGEVRLATPENKQEATASKSNQGITNFNEVYKSQPADSVIIEGRKESLNLDLSNGEKQIWLVKLPKFLANKWNDIDQIGGQEIGNLRIYKSNNIKNSKFKIVLKNIPKKQLSGSSDSKEEHDQKKSDDDGDDDDDWKLAAVKNADGTTSTKLTSSKKKGKERGKEKEKDKGGNSDDGDEDFFEGIPHEYNLRINNFSVKNQFIFSEENLTNFKKEDKKDSKANEKNDSANARVKKQTKKKMTRQKFIQQQLKAGNNNYLPFVKSIPKKTALLGTICHEGSITPCVTDKDYVNVLQDRKSRIMAKPNRPIIEVLKENEGVIQTFSAPSLKGDDNGRGDSFIKASKDKDSKDGKQVRMEKKDLLDLLFKLFDEYDYWSLKGLKERVKQPENFLKECLESIAVLHKSGKYASKYSLQDQYKKLRDIERREKLKQLGLDPSTIQTEGQEEEDDDDDDDDVEMENVA